MCFGIHTPMIVVYGYNLQKSPPRQRALSASRFQHTPMRVCTHTHTGVEYLIQHAKTFDSWLKHQNNKGRIKTAQPRNAVKRERANPHGAPNIPIWIKIGTVLVVTLLAIIGFGSKSSTSEVSALRQDLTRQLSAVTRTLSEVEDAATIMSKLTHGYAEASQLQAQLEGAMGAAAGRAAAGQSEHDSEGGGTELS